MKESVEKRLQDNVAVSTCSLCSKTFNCYEIETELGKKSVCLRCVNKIVFKTLKLAGFSYCDENPDIDHIGCFT